MNTTISPAEKFQNEVQSLIKKYISENYGGNKIPCAELCLYLFGWDAHKAEDKISEMRATITDLLTFLADPEISLAFQKVRTAYSDNYPVHLGRLIYFLTDIDNPLAYAELANYQLNSGIVDENRVIMYHKKYSKK
jgi:hypothetical protein